MGVRFRGTSIRSKLCFVAVWFHYSKQVHHNGVLCAACEQWGRDQWWDLYKYPFHPPAEDASRYGRYADMCKTCDGWGRNPDCDRKLGRV